MVELTKKRPVWVWIISIYYFISVAFGVLFLGLIFSGGSAFSPFLAHSLRKFTTIDYTVMVLKYTLMLGSALTLFLMRKQALLFFLASLVLSIAALILPTVANATMRSNPVPILVLCAIGFLLQAAICLYCWSLIKKGILQ
jgi:hypothetical protein